MILKRFSLVMKKTGQPSRLIFNFVLGQASPIGSVGFADPRKATKGGGADLL
jgi:hypothetical protein